MKAILSLLILLLVASRATAMRRLGGSQSAGSSSPGLLDNVREVAHWARKLLLGPAPAKPKTYAPRQGSLVAFFHIYQQHAALATSVVEEQLEQVRQANANGANISRVKYTTIAGPEDQTYECEICEKVAHQKKGDEVVTLQQLYDHCAAEQSEYVMYIHSKGAFHPSESNTVFRRFLMQGVTSGECMHMPGVCDVCGLRFSAFPHHHMPGNMWVARCDYVRKLLPPKQFQGRMEEALGGREWRRRTGLEDFEVGAGRFAAEHWVGSHPSLRPCDVDTSTYLKGYWGFPSELNAELHVGPRSELFPDMTRFGPWRSYEWKSLYGAKPPAGSWAWTMYGK